MTYPLAPTGLLPDAVESIADQLSRNAAARGDELALISVDDGRSLTWAALRRMTVRVAHLLRGLGIGANDRVAVLGENSLETLILYYGVQAWGATWCTINVEVNRHHLIEMLDRIGPKLVFCQGGLGLEELAAPGAWMNYGRHDGDGDGGLFSKLAEMPEEAVPDPVNEPEDRCVISFTSGTEAQPKGVLHSFCNYQAIAQHQLDRWGLTSDDRILEFRSFSWASAHMLSLNPAALAGCTLLFARRFSRSRFAGWIRDWRPTVIVAVPTVVNLLLESPPADAGTIFAGVRFVSCSTAPLMPEQHRRFEAVYGLPLVQLYGMSEGGVVAANRPETRRIGSVGQPGLYQDIAIRGPDGAALPPGETGAIETTSAQHAHAYLHAGGGLEPIRGRPLPTGDMGYLDRDGFLIVTGRARDVIIRGGVNIAPLEIDAVLTAHEGVAEACTFGIPDPIYGEEIASWVAAKPGAEITPRVLARHCAALLPEAKRPKHIAVVDSIPKNERGKIDRNAARAAWRSEREA
jgi:acyl-coenzyme A synthetase/AMP-(fatty) acid ligase